MNNQEPQVGQIMRSPLVPKVSLPTSMNYQVDGGSKDSISVKLEDQNRDQRSHARSNLGLQIACHGPYVASQASWILVWW